MANQDEAKRKIVILAVRAKQGMTSTAEDAKIIRSVDAGRIKNRADLTRELAEAINKTPAEVGVILASDDSDRLADEIISLLKE